MVHFVTVASKFFPYRGSFTSKNHSRSLEGIFCFEWFVWLGQRVCCVCLCVCGRSFGLCLSAAAVCVGGVVIGVCHKITKDVQVLQGEARYRE
jgi:hypothetical protein